jgi:hypothetical protein
MSNDPKSDSSFLKRFPERVLIALISHPDRDFVWLELVEEGVDWGDLPTASYVLESSAAE